MFTLTYPTSESRFSPRALDGFHHHMFALVGPKVKRINAGIELVEHCCHSHMGAAAKMLSAQKCSRTTSETMWKAGSTGQRGEGCLLITWTTSFLSLAILSLHHGLLPLSTTTRMQLIHRQYLCTPKISLTVARNFSGATFAET
jgi:hypothetical protein